MLIDIIIPAYNEEDNILPLYKMIKKQLKDINYNIIFVNDGSSDNTLLKMKELSKEDKDLKIISFTRNFGKDAAIFAGLKYSKAKYAVFIDADLQQEPKYILKMLDVLDNNPEYDMVTMVNDYSKCSFIERLLKKSFYKFMKLTTSENYVIGASDFRLIRHSVVKELLTMEEKNIFMKGLFAYLGFNQYCITYIPNNRKAGKSKFNIIKQFKYAFTGIVSMSTKPLIKLSIVEFIITIFLFIITLFISNIKLILLVIMLLFVLLFINLLVLSMYIRKIYDESNNRPLYVIRETIGIKKEK